MGLCGCLGGGGGRDYGLLGNEARGIRLGRKHLERSQGAKRSPFLLNLRETRIFAKGRGDGSARLTRPD